ncbi:WhiB family transcriptional regulator [uncultured Tessaracoccus sp.]|uniref:WhiB family transcriptional regulator n=1 Tax=uncultured Tessaracoccus sp. TaxID=905023 RepID=UPI0026207E9B|nr:WhiB family transcriptional regulator [uncultured Tessaracoccus sp.]
MTDQLAPCVNASNVFLHPLLEEGATPSTRVERREQAMLRSQAARLCANCPMLAQCLSDAVVKHEVTGFVAGTTKRQRQEIRARLGVQISNENIDIYAGVNSGRQFDRHEIHRLRQANPDEPLSVIAQKIGCSVSTVKRHLRRIELENTVPEEPVAPVLPSPEQVLATAKALRATSQRVAA